MIILVNPRAGAVTALVRWQAVEPHIRSRFGDVRVLHTTSPGDMESAVLEASQSDDPRIVAAGGDGTANAVINAILRLDPADRDRCVMGAIGLGSSNDFHKPFIQASMIGRLPARLAFDRAEACDAGLMQYSLNGQEHERYFFLNASVGITAEGNARFNAPGALLRFLKRTHVPSAITYAALTSLVRYKNQSIRFSIRDFGTITAPITNLGILKSPYFSGALHYDTARDYTNGRFVVVACLEMNIPERFALFRALRKGSLAGAEHVRTWSTSVLDLESPSPIPIELDGEIVIARKAHFTVQPRILKVCP
jgi:diacylglycerol kinase family enzyme